MKKIVLETQVSKIHIAEITKNDLIIAKKDNKTIGFILWHVGSDEWICKYNSGINSWDGQNSLVGLLENTISLRHCDFYVFDE